MDFTHDRNMLKQVKEAKKKLEGRDLLKQSNLKHFGFSILFVVVAVAKWPYISLVFIVEKTLTSFRNFLRS